MENIETPIIGFLRVAHVLIARVLEVSIMDERHREKLNS